MIRKSGLVILVLGILLTLSVRGHALEAKISDIVISAGKKDLLVYFKVSNCFTKKMEEAIFAGIPTTFTFALELLQERDLWFDQKIVSGETKHTIKYDTVKKIFYVTFSGDGRGPLEFTDFSGAKQAMEEVNAAAISPLNQLSKEARYYVKVKAKLDKVSLPLHMENVFFFVSLWDFETNWYRQDFRYK
jgi:hypothetical protein